MSLVSGDEFKRLTGLTPPSLFRVGMVVNHKDHGPVYIESGQYLSNGRLSNHWRFRPVMPDGSLGESFGEYPEPMKELAATVEIRVTLTNP